MRRKMQYGVGEKQNKIKDWEKAKKERTLKWTGDGRPKTYIRARAPAREHD